MLLELSIWYSNDFYCFRLRWWRKTERKEGRKEAAWMTNPKNALYAIYGTKGHPLKCEQQQQCCLAKNNNLYNEIHPRMVNGKWQMAMNWNWYTPKIFTPHWEKPQGSKSNSKSNSNSNQKGQQQEQVGGDGSDCGCAPQRNWFAHPFALASYTEGLPALCPTPWLCPFRNLVWLASAGSSSLAAFKLMPSGILLPVLNSIKIHLPWDPERQCVMLHGKFNYPRMVARGYQHRTLSSTVLSVSPFLKSNKVSHN